MVPGAKTSGKHEKRGGSAKSPKPAKVAAALRDLRPVQNQGGSAGKGDKNLYLASLADPAANANARIPDANTMPSTTFQTTARFQLATGSDGREIVAITPSIENDIFRPMRFDDGPYEGRIAQQTTNTFDNTANYVAGSISNSLIATEIEAIKSNFSALRPVSAVLTITPIAAALTTTGLLLAGVWPREQMLAAWDTVVTGNPTNGGITSDPNSGAWDNDRAPKNMTEFLSTNLTMANGLASYSVTWKPQDESCYCYRPTTTGVTTGNINSANSYSGGWVEWSYITTTNTEFINYVSPWPVMPSYTDGVIGNPQVSGQYQPVPVNEEFAYPYFVVAISGGPANTSMFEATLIINWEAIPLVLATNIVPVAASPYNPDELAQAQNIINEIPPVAITSMPNDPVVKLRSEVKTAATHLYDGKTSRKAAVEGTSLWTRVKKWASQMDWSKVISSGASLIATLL